MSKQISRPLNMERPFPHARISQAQQDEDAFMQLHGGIGSRLIYRLCNPSVPRLSVALKSIRAWAVGGRALHDALPWRD